MIQLLIVDADKEIRKNFKGLYEYDPDIRFFESDGKSIPEHLSHGSPLLVLLDYHLGQSVEATSTWLNMFQRTYATLHHKEVHLLTGNDVNDLQLRDFDLTHHLAGHLRKPVSPKQLNHLILKLARLPSVRRAHKYDNDPKKFAEAADDLRLPIRLFREQDIRVATDTVIEPVYENSAARERGWTSKDEQALKRLIATLRRNNGNQAKTLEQEQDYTWWRRRLYRAGDYYWLAAEQVSRAHDLMNNVWGHPKWEDRLNVLANEFKAQHGITRLRLYEVHNAHDVNNRPLFFPRWQIGGGLVACSEEEWFRNVLDKPALPEIDKTLGTGLAEFTPDCTGVIPGNAENLGILWLEDEEHSLQGVLLFDRRTDHLGHTLDEEYDLKLAQSDLRAMAGLLRAVRPVFLAYLAEDKRSRDDKYSEARRDILINAVSHDSAESSLKMALEGFAQQDYRPGYAETRHLILLRAHGTNIWEQWHKAKKAPAQEAITPAWFNDFPEWLSGEMLSQIVPETDNNSIISKPLCIQDLDKTADIPQFLPTHGSLLVYKLSRQSHSLALCLIHVPSPRRFTQPFIVQWRKSLEQLLPIVLWAEQERARSWLTASLGHELLTPGQSILSSVEKVEMGDKNAFNDIRTAVIYLQGVIGSVHSFAKLNLHPKESKTSCNLQKVLKETLDIVRGYYQDRELLIPESLPAQTCRLPTNELRQILFNLLGNACKYSSDKVVNLSWDDRTRQLVIGNRTKSSIHPNEVGQLFVPYYRRHSETEGEGGGIGLAVVKQIASNRGIEVKASTKEQGMWLDITVTF